MPVLFVVDAQAVMQAALSRHDRHGLTAECSLPVRLLNN